jgi:hypothetical protein
MDVHVPKSVTEQLRLRGVDVLTAIEDGSNTLEDADLLERAGEFGRVLVTQDIRFRVRAEMWQATGRPFAGLVFAHPLEITIGQFVGDLEILALASLDGECKNQVFRLPL